MIRPTSIRTGALAFSLGLALLAGCGSPINLTNGSNSTTPMSARATLQNLPELKVTLPASLTKTATTTTAKSMARAMGDTTEISSVPALKSQAWFDLQSSNNFQGFINKAFKFLRAYATAHDVKLDESFTIPITDDDLVTVLGMPDSARGTIATTVQMRISGNESTKLTIYALVTAKGTTQATSSLAVTVKARMDVAPVSGGKVIDFYMKAEQTSGTGSFSLPFYAHFNTATGACDIIQDVSMTFNNDSYSSQMIQKSIIGTNGDVTTVNLSRQGNTVGSVQVAYGDNVSGGIASMFRYTEDSQSHSSIWGEYYDGSGNLVKRVNGQDTLYVPLWSGTTPVLNLKNLGYAAAPAEIQQQWEYNVVDSYSYLQVKKADATWMSVYRQNWNGSQLASDYSDNGTDWTNNSSGSWGRSIVWKTDDSPVWKGGDVIYYWKSWDGGTETLYQGYVVPTPVNRFGVDYFTSNEYPLDTLLPLQGSYATAYKLIQQEGYTSNWTWTDSDGKERNESWTSYSFFLNKNQVGEDPIRMNTSDGDISLDNSLSSYDMYYYQNGVESKKRGYFLRTTGAVPAYFKQPDTSLVSRVDSKLDEALQTAYNLDLSAYSPQLAIAKGDLTAGIFSN